MNMTPILRQLSVADFNKMLAACTFKEQLFLKIARLDPGFEYHVDLPGCDEPHEPENIASWHADEKRFPND